MPIRATRESTTSRGGQCPPYEVAPGGQCPPYEVDLSKFFDKVQHDVLLVRVARKVHDKRLLKLIGRYLRAGIMVEGIVQPSQEGTMQGGPLFPLLANILLDDFDRELE